jgi:hypothetical protein
VAAPPVGSADSYDLNAAETLVVPAPGVLANDTSPASLTLTAELESGAAFGDLTLRADGGFTYVNDGSRNIADSFSYRAVDDAGSSPPATVSLRVNVAPEAFAQSLVTREDAPLSLTLDAEDPNDDELRFVLGTGPTHGTLSAFDEVAGTLVYTPQAGYVGADSFTFSATDGVMTSTPATVSVYVNGAPYFTSIPPPQTVIAGRLSTPVSLSIADPEDPASSLALVARSARPDVLPNAGLSLTGTGATRSLTFTPLAGVAGVVTVTLELSDGLSTTTADLAVHVGVTHNLDAVEAPGNVRRALEVAQDGDTITFDPSHFRSDAALEQRTILLGSELLIDRSLTIRGPDQTALILSGNHTVRVLRVSGSEVELIDLTVADGAAGSGFGGGILAEGGWIRLAGCAVVGNSAQRGGGIYTSSAEMVVTGSIIADNVADLGGGVYNGKELTVIDSKLAGNAADLGGGIYNASILDITHTSLRGNSATQGGGLYNDVDVYSTRIYGSTFAENHAEFGGGIYNTGGSDLVITNVTIGENSGTFRGGGVYNDAGDVALYFSTVFGNRVDSLGGSGGVGGGIGHVTGSFTVYGTIVAGNVRGAAGEEEPDEITNVTPLTSASAHNLVGDAASANVLEDGVSGNIVGVDWATVLAGALANSGGRTETYPLLAGSPAIDAIPTVKCTDAKGLALTTDQRDMPRPAAVACDVGAYERQA